MQHPTTFYHGMEWSHISGLSFSVLLLVAVLSLLAVAAVVGLHLMRRPGAIGRQ